MLFRLLTARGKIIMKWDYYWPFAIGNHCGFPSQKASNMALGRVWHVCGEYIGRKMTLL